MRAVARFLVLGLGCDDAFVLVGGLARDRDGGRGGDGGGATVGAGAALRDSLGAIALTTATDAAAFASGAFVGVPALRHFALFATLAVVLDFLMQVRIQ